MRNKFDEQLELLNVELIKMGSMCEEAIGTAAEAMFQNSEALRKKVYSVDSDIDQKERDIESLCMKLLLQQQPVAKDLRLISSAIKMISDMERIGDQASDIAEISEYIGDMDETGMHATHIGDMAKATIKMVTDSVSSFVNKDLSLAKAVMDYDDRVDDLFDKIKNELIHMLGTEDVNGEYCIDLLMIAKYFERIGDHATNIAEWVVFSITGKHEG